MVIDRGELDENQRIERDERIVELLMEAAKRIDPRHGFDELAERLRKMAFEVHADLDPHCTCNDCIEEFAGGLDNA